MHFSSRAFGASIIVLAGCIAACSAPAPGRPYSDGNPPQPKGDGGSATGKLTGGSDSGGGTAGDDNAGDADALTDSGAPDDAQDDGTPPSGPAATWSQIYTSYLGGGTVGGCGNAGCHAEMSTASSSYTWLTQKGQIGGTKSALVDSTSSILSWYGGTMPPSGPTSDPPATAALNSWVASGAPNN